MAIPIENKSLPKEHKTFLALRLKPHIFKGSYQTFPGANICFLREKGEIYIEKLLQRHKLFS